MAVVIKKLKAFEIQIFSITLREKGEKSWKRQAEEQGQKERVRQMGI